MTKNIDAILPVPEVAKSSVTKVYIFVDIEEGHILPTIGLSQSLRDSGYEVTLIGIADHKASLEKLGFQYITVFEKDYPLGFYKNVYKEQMRTKRQSAGFKPHIEVILNGELDELFKVHQPDLFIVSSFMAMEALLFHYLYQVDPILFSMCLMEHKLSSIVGEEFSRLSGGVAFKAIETIQKHTVRAANVADLLLPVDQFTEVIACPQEFEIPGEERGAYSFYVEPCIRHAAGEPFPLLDQIPDGTPIIYASLGSQTALYAAQCKEFFHKLLAMMELPDFQGVHLLLSIGSEFQPEDFGQVSDQIHLVKWVPQLEVLKRASLVITHSGLNTIKECIYHGIPMLAYPIMRDGPKNAARIEYHQIGAKIDGFSISIEELASKTKKLLTDEHIRENTLRMQKVFVEMENNRPSAGVIEKSLMKLSVAQ